MTGRFFIRLNLGINLQWHVLVLAVFKILSIMLAPCDKVGGVHSLRERFVVHHTDFHMRVFGVRKIHKGKSLATVVYVFRNFSS